MSSRWAHHQQFWVNLTAVIFLEAEHKLSSLIGGIQICHDPMTHFTRQLRWAGREKAIARRYPPTGRGWQSLNTVAKRVEHNFKALLSQAGRPHCATGDQNHKRA